MGRAAGAPAPKAATQRRPERFDYSDAVGASWKMQTLLNSVNLRYLDPPIFLDVGQILVSRSLQRLLSVSGGALPALAPSRLATSV